MPLASLQNAGALGSQGRQLASTFVRAIQRGSPSATLTRPVAALLLALLLVGCSKTVRWEEEVPLNTGEVIWVKRSATYSIKGAAGNPMDIGYRLDWKETLSFNWRGRSYSYEGDADLMLLAISPQNSPVLVAPAGNKSWDWKHDYRCATPHYVQLVPDVSGRNWNWPPELEPWLHGLPANLMAQRRNPGEMKARYSTEDRNAEDAVSRLQSPVSATVDRKHISKNCKRKE